MATPSRVLLVEDNLLNLKLVRDVLLHAGFDVVEARSGEDGIMRALEDQPDIILMDLQLPGIDGTEAMRTIKQDSDGLQHSDRRADRICDVGGPRAGASQRLRRLSEQADQR